MATNLSSNIMDPSNETQLHPVARPFLSRPLEILIYTAVVVKGTYTHMGPWAAVVALMVLQLALIPYLGFTDTKLAHTAWKFMMSCFLVAPRVWDPARALQQGFWNELCTVVQLGVFLYAAWDLAMLFEVEQRQDDRGRNMLVVVSGCDLEIKMHVPAAMISWPFQKRYSSHLLEHFSGRKECDVIITRTTS